MEFISGSALIVGLAYQYVTLTRERREMEQEYEAMQVDPSTSGNVGRAEQETVIDETGCCSSDPADRSQDVIYDPDPFNPKNCTASISAEPQAGTFSCTSAVQKPPLSEKVCRVVNGKVVKLNHQETEKGAGIVPKTAVKKPAVCKPGKITANPFFNFLRVFRQTHCGQQQQVVVQEAAMQWNRMSCEQKCHYTKQAVTHRIRNKS